MKFIVIGMFVPVQKQTLLTLELYHRLLAMITSLTLAVDILTLTNSTLRTHYGMVLAVGVAAPAVSSTTHCKQLPQPTTDDIELRLCNCYDQAVSDEKILLLSK